MLSGKSKRIVFGVVFVVLTLLRFTIGVPSAKAREGALFFATSADDPFLRARIANLGPNVESEEAQRVARCAYVTGRELKKEWGVVWPPGLMNLLVNTGRRKGGLCFHFATELLHRLDALKLETLDLHWAESYERTMSEHNVIVVTAKGQPFQEGILLDNWRYGGRLIWGPLNGDLEYKWTENKTEYARRLKMRYNDLSGPITPAGR
jgi:hypothetical protein